MSLTKIVLGISLATGVAATTLTYEPKQTEEVKDQLVTEVEYNQPETKIEYIDFEPLEIVGNPNSMLEAINFNNLYEENRSITKTIYEN